MVLHAFPGALGSQYNSVQRSNNIVSTTTHTSSGTAHTYATWTQLVASAPFDVHGVFLRINTSLTTTTRSDVLVSLGVGGAGSEQTVIGPMALGGKVAGTQISLPIFIPAGSRISVRHKTERLSFAVAYTLDLYGSPNRDSAGLPSMWIPYGNVDDSTNSRGTQITSGDTNTWGSWTALTTSTTYAHSLWVPLVDQGTAAGNTSTLGYRTQFAVASITDAATMVTNGTVWDGPFWQANSADYQQDRCGDMTAAGSWAIGDGRFRPNGIIYQSAPAGAAVSVRALCSGTHEDNVFASVLAAI